MNTKNNYVNRYRFRRMSIIYRELQIVTRQGKKLTCKALMNLVNKYVDEDLTVCKSTIEKDIFSMKMDLDIELIPSNKGYQLAEEVDFKERVLTYLKIEL